MTRDYLRKHCEEMCRRSENIPTSSMYEEHKFVLDLLNQTEWIPVKEKLPDNKGIYLVTKSIRDTNFVNIVYFDERDFINALGTFGCTASDIVAWMPLPEAYKEEKQNGNSD